MEEKHCFVDRGGQGKKFKCENPSQEVGLNLKKQQQQNEKEEEEVVGRGGLQGPCVLKWYIFPKEMLWYEGLVSQGCHNSVNCSGLFVDANLLAPSTSFVTPGIHLVSKSYFYSIEDTETPPLRCESVQDRDPQFTYLPPWAPGIVTGIEEA